MQRPSLHDGKRRDGRFRPTTDGKWLNRLEPRNLAAPNLYGIIGAHLGGLRESTGVGSLLGLSANPVGQAIGSLAASSVTDAADRPQCHTAPATLEVRSIFVRIPTLIRWDPSTVAR